MKDQEIQNSNEQQRSFAPLVRVLIVFPIIVIAGSYVGRLIVDTYELPSPGSFLGFVGLATVLGWFYVGYEYKRARKKLSLDKKNKQ